MRAFTTVRLAGGSRANERTLRRLAATSVASASLFVLGCGESERSTDRSAHRGSSGTAGSDDGSAASDAGRGTSGAAGGSGPAGTSGTVAGGANMGGATGGGAGTANASAAAGALAGGDVGAGTPGLGGSAGSPTPVAGSAGTTESEGGATGGTAPELDTTPWREWAVMPMPNAPGSDLPHIQKYTVGVDTVHDDVTGLTWQRRIQTQYLDPEKAKPYCEGLELDGNSGFRVPRLIELVTLIDYLRGEHAVDGSAFDLGIGEIVGSSTRTSYSTLPKYWMVDFIAGRATDRAETATGTLCVSGGPTGELPEHYTTGGGLVVDHWTGLTWAPGSSAGVPYADAVAACAALTLDGGGFRLPSINEVWTAWDFSKIPAEMDQSLFGFESYGSGFWVAPEPRVTPEGKHLAITAGANVSQATIVDAAELLCVR